MTSPISLQFQSVGFGFDSSTRPLITGLDLDLQTGWTGVVGRNGSGKTTILRLATGELMPSEGQVSRRGEALLCEQETHDPPNGLEEWLTSADAEAWRWRARLDIGTDWDERFDTLSHGERKRLQLGSALFRDPSILAVDEPTNHLDRDGRRFVLEALRAYRGVGLIVSHDRELLDALCDRCLFVESGSLRLRPGGYSAGVTAAAFERENATRVHERDRRELKRLEREAIRRREVASQAKKRLSKRGIDPKDHDARDRIDKARVSGKDTAAGRRLRQMDGRLDRSRQALERSARPPGERLGLTWKESEVIGGAVAELPEGELVLSVDEGRVLRYPRLEIRSGDRVAITGANGAGKSCLVRAILNVARSRLRQEDSIFYLPQEIRPDEAEIILARARSLPRRELGEVMSTVQRLGSDPNRVLETDLPSPGEVRKLRFALGTRLGPRLIVMDEPTNHLDLASVECLEAALADVGSALLLVSHDPRFIRSLVAVEWRIVDGAVVPGTTSHDPN